MKKLVLGIIGITVASSNQIRINSLNDECPHDLEVICIDDINKAYPVCQKAAREKGKDLSADIQCMKYFVMDKQCWPCICMIAQINKWPIIGCGK